jgi:hypothetical protein
MFQEIANFEEDSTVSDKNEENQPSIDPFTQHSTTNQIKPNKRCLKRKNTGQEERTNKERLLGLACETLTQNKSNDRCEIFGSNVAVKLKVMSREQQLLAEKIISEVLFYGELGQLTLHTVKMIPNVLSPDSQLLSRTPSSLSSPSMVYYPQQTSPDIPSPKIYTQLHNYNTDNIMYDKYQWGQNEATCAKRGSNNF